DLTELTDPTRGDHALKQLLASPNIASKEWVYEQYDHMVRLNTLVMPGSDAAVMRIPDSQKAVALAVDCNSRYCYLDPYLGAQIAVAECARNIACSGGTPIGLTNCLNFGNPEKPEIMWQFEQSVLGIAEACKFFDIPVVSGNVSLYNETKGSAIYPTPTVAVVGLLENLDDHSTQWFKNSGDVIALLGLTLEEISGSEYLKLAFDMCRGKPPHLDKKLERSVQELCLQLIREKTIHSAHDCSDGGLAVAVAESCFTGPEKVLGATLNLKSTLRKDALLFGESQSRILISFSEENREAIARMAKNKEVPFTVIGRVGGSHFTVNVNGDEFIQQDIQALKNIWKNTIGDYARQVS
ncbi:Phosphoribosylformylglycinamidine synthase, synthetase subunit, partial [hydrothermal vent metagenome]